MNYLEVGHGQGLAQLWIYTGNDIMYSRKDEGVKLDHARWRLWLENCAQRFADGRIDFEKKLISINIESVVPDIAKEVKKILSLDYPDFKFKIFS